MAASGQDEVTGPDGETFIEKYTRGVSAVETILTLDRLRQSVAVKELINAKSKHLLPMGGQSTLLTNNNSGASPFMRKTVSVPNISHVRHPSFLHLGGIQKLRRQEGVGGQSNVYAYKVNGRFLFDKFVYEGWVGVWSKMSKILST